MKLVGARGHKDIEGYRKADEMARNKVAKPLKWPEFPTGLPQVSVS